MWWIPCALGAEVEVDLPDQAPAELPLFARVQVLPVRGSWKGPECASAVEAARALAAREGTVLRWVQSSTDLQAQSQAICKQRLAGDSVSNSIVELNALVVTAGTGDFPTLPKTRVGEIAELLLSLQPEGAVLELEEADGRVWVRFPAVIEPKVLDSRALDSNARGAWLYDRHVTQWAVGFSRALLAVPEVAGASVELTVTSEDITVKKSRTTEIYRFRVPTAQAVAYSKGELGDERLVEASTIERATNPKKRDFLRFLLEVDELSLTSEDTAVSAPAPRPQLEEIDDIEDE